MQDMNKRHIVGEVFEASDADSQVVYPTPVGKDLSWIRRKLGMLFGTRCPACSSKNFEVNYLLHPGRNFCQDCGHLWGKELARRYEP